MDTPADPSLSISLPPRLLQFVESEIDAGNYPTPSDFVQSLLRDAQRRKAKEKLEELLLEGLASGSTEMTDDDWEMLREKARNRHRSQETT